MGRLFFAASIIQVPVWYLLFSFIAADVNAFNWPEEGRMVLVVVCVLCFFALNLKSIDILEQGK